MAEVPVNRDLTNRSLTLVPVRPGLATRINQASASPQPASSTNLTQTDNSTAGQKVFYFADEILETIFENLRTNASEATQSFNEKTRTLIAITRTCKQFSHVATPMLWENIRVNMLQTSNSKLLLRSLLNSPDCATYVRDIRFEFVDGDPSRAPPHLSKKELRDLSRQCASTIKALRINQVIKLAITNALAVRLASPPAITLQAARLNTMRGIDLELILILVSIPWVEVVEICLDPRFVDYRKVELKPFKHLEVFVDCLNHLRISAARRRRTGPVYLADLQVLHYSSSRFDTVSDRSALRADTSAVNNLRAPLVATFHGHDLRLNESFCSKLKKLMVTKCVTMALDGLPMNHLLINHIASDFEYLGSLDLKFIPTDRRTFYHPASYMEAGISDRLRHLSIDGWQPPTDSVGDIGHMGSLQELTVLHLPATMVFGTPIRTRAVPAGYLGMILPAPLQTLSLYYSMDRYDRIHGLVEQQELDLMMIHRSFPRLHIITIGRCSLPGMQMESFVDQCELLGWGLAAQTDPPDAEDGEYDLEFRLM